MRIHVRVGTQSLIIGFARNDQGNATTKANVLALAKLVRRGCANLARQLRPFAASHSAADCYIVSLAIVEFTTGANGHSSHPGARRTTLHLSIWSRAFRSPQRDGLRAGEECKEGLSILRVSSPRGDGNGHIHIGAQLWWKTTDQRRIGW